MHLKRYRAAIWFLVLLVWWATSTASARVLCVGDDGHVAIEHLALHDCASEREGRIADTSSFTVVEERSPCGQCIDTLLGTEARRHGDVFELPPTNWLPLSTPLTHAVLILAWLPVQATLGAWRAPGRSGHVLTAARSGTILRC